MRTGYLCGEQHPKAVLTDHDVDLIREVYESGDAGYMALAKKFDVAKSTIRNIVKCRRRAFGGVSMV